MATATLARPAGGPDMAGLITRLLDRPRADASQTITHPKALEDAIRGEKSWSGQDVTVNRALNVGALFAGTRVICEDIGKLPFPVFRENDQGERERARNSPYWRIVHDRPNPWMTSQQFREMLTGHAILRGNGFAWPQVRNGQIRNLIPLHPDRVEIEVLDDGEPIFHVQLNERGPRETLGHREIFWLPGYMVDGPGGVSVVKYARQTLGHALATEHFGARFFGNGMKPGGAFKTPTSLSEEGYNRLKGDLNDQSPERAHETLLLEEGLEWQQIGISNEDSQFLQTRQFEVTEIARWLRVPPHKISDLSRATFSNIEQQSLDYIQDTLMTWGVRWQHAVNNTVIKDPRQFAEILYDALLQTDTKTRYEAHRIAVGAPWKTRNEVRRTDNLPAIDGLDEMITPLNVSDESGDSSSREEGSNAQAQ